MFEWKRNSGGPIPASKMSGNTGCGVLKFQPKLGELSPRHVPLVPAQAEELVAGPVRVRCLAIRREEKLRMALSIVRTVHAVG